MCSPAFDCRMTCFTPIWLVLGSRWLYWSYAQVGAQDAQPQAEPCHVCVNLLKNISNRAVQRHLRSLTNAVYFNGCCATCGAIQEFASGFDDLDYLGVHGASNRASGTPLARSTHSCCVICECLCDVVVIVLCLCYDGCTYHRSVQPHMHVHVGSYTPLDIPITC